MYGYIDIFMSNAISCPTDIEYAIFHFVYRRTVCVNAVENLILSVKAK